MNKYPTDRSFKAIGSGGQDFVEHMVTAVRSATGQQSVSVQQRPSKHEKYISVTLGPVLMSNSDQVHIPPAR